MDCRQQLDVLKKRYKKERAKIERTGSNNSSWMHFRKMDMLMMGGAGSGSGSSSNGGRVSGERFGLPCGVDSGEFCFADMDVYLEKSNAFDEMRDSPGEEEVEEDELDDEQEMEVDLDLDDDDLPPRRREDGGEGIRVLADSIERFGEVYEMMENSKRAQMTELRKLKADFLRELESQKNEIMDRANAEIAKIKAEGGESYDSDSECEDDYSSNDA
ncbi:hypothetical protein MLD38_015015 [Melastoma candidum]|nr:hypothetical protein MLD38_015015 [Melastoma candidum]